MPLARHFLRVYGPRLNLRDAALSADAEAALRGYLWPGNIRELENVIHYALIVCRKGVVEAADLKLVAQVAAPRPAAVLTAQPSGESHGGDAAPGSLRRAIDALLDAGAPDLLHSIESQLVHAAFAHAGRNQVQAARALGTTRNTLRTLLKRHGLLAEPGSDTASSAALPAAPDNPVALGLPLTH